MRHRDDEARDSNQGRFYGVCIMTIKTTDDTENLFTQAAEDIRRALRIEAPYLFRLDWSPIPDDELTFTDAEWYHFDCHRDHDAPPPTINPITDKVCAQIEEIMARPWDMAKVTVETSAHNRAILREALMLGARGYMPMPAHRPHPQAGCTANARSHLRSLKKAWIQSPATIKAQAARAKLPVGIEWPTRASCDLETIWENFNKYPARVYKDGKPTDQIEIRYIDFAVNLCIVTGMRAGYAVADIDGEAARARWSEMGEVPRTVQSLSGSQEGDHYFFRTPPGIEVRNTASKFGTHGADDAEGTGLDVRGYHGQVIIAPSQHKRGGSYSWVNSPHDTPLAMAPQWWLDEARACSKKAQREAGMPLAAKVRKPKTVPEDDGSDAEFEESTGKLAGGWLNRVAQIGYGEGTANCCHFAINSAALSFFWERGHAAEKSPLFDALRERLDVATEGNSDKRHYYDDTASLTERIEEARAFAKSEGCEAEKPWGYHSREEGEEAIKAVARKDGAAVEVVVRRIALSSVSLIDQDDLLKKLATTVGAKLGTINALMKVARKEAAKTRKQPGSAPDASDFMATMNSQFAVYEGQGKVSILHLPDRPGKFPNPLSRENFMLLREACRVIGEAADGSPIRAGVVWLNAVDQRRDVNQIVFEPTGSRYLPVPESAINAFNGLPVLEDMKAFNDDELRAKCSLYLDHIARIICDGDAGANDYLLNWLADLFQVPGHKIGSAILVVGGFGSGKTTLWEVLKPALGDYLLKLNQSNDLVGNFNDHTVGKLLTVSEEATYASDKSGANTLKDIITSDDKLVKTKFHSAYAINDYTRVLYLSNDLARSVEVSEGDRRTTVLQTSNTLTELRERDRQAWKRYGHELRAQMSGGGLAAFVELMHRRKYDPDELRQPYETEIRREMMRNQLDPAKRWLSDLVVTGMCSGGRDAVDASEPAPAVYLYGPSSKVVNHRGEYMVALPKKDLRAHFKDAISRAPERFAKADYGTVNALRRLMVEMLDAVESSAKIGASSVPCYLVPKIDALMPKLKARGFVPSDTVPASFEGDTQEPDEKWDAYGKDARDATDAALALLRQVAPDQVDALTQALQRERGCMVEYEALCESGVAFSQATAALS